MERSAREKGWHSKQRGSQILKSLKEEYDFHLLLARRPFCWSRMI